MSTDRIRKPGRPLDTRLRADLLRATQDLLIEVGYERLSVDAVARRCGAGKAAVYRRWPGKAEMAVAAAVDACPPLVVPDYGELRRDLLAAARACAMGGARGQMVMASILAAGRHDPHLRGVTAENMKAQLANLIERVLIRGVEYGTVPDDVDIHLVSEVLPALVFHRSMTDGQAVDTALVGHIVDSIVLPALRSRR